MDELTAENERLRARWAEAEETHRRVEAELRRSRMLLEAAQRVAGVGSWVSDATRTGRLEWSKETYRIFGRDEQTFDGRVESFFAMVHPDDVARVSEASRAALAGEAPYRVDHRILRPDGSVRMVHEEAEISRDAQGNPTQMLGTVQDVTEQTETEDRRRQTQKMEAVGRLAGGVAHDVNNVLTAILGYADLLSRQVGGVVAAQEPLAQIRSAASRAAALTRRLLAFSHKQVVAPALLDVNAFVQATETALRRTIGEEVRLVSDLCPEAARVRIGEGDLEQVLLNLAANARDAMPGGGTLLVETRTREVSSGEVVGDERIPAGAYVTLAVGDTGTGMTAEVKRHLFEPFFTTKGEGKGTGLGLAAVYGIVKQAGGHVHVSSEPGQGSRFAVLLPRVEGAAQLAPAPGAAFSARGTESVLVVEDDASIREMIAEVLRQQGYEVLAAGTGEAALALMAQRALPIDLLLTDVVMPGMNGRELWERLAAERPGTPVLFISGYPDDEVLERGVRSADVAFLQKPFTPTELCLEIRAVLDRSSRHAPR